jgi:hypothetical protein
MMQARQDGTIELPDFLIFSLVLVEPKSWANGIGVFDLVFRECTRSRQCENPTDPVVIRTSRQCALVDVQ